MLHHKDQALLDAIAAAMPGMVAKLQGDLPSQAKLLWALQELQFRNAQLEAALQQVVPHNVQDLLGAH